VVFLLVLGTELLRALVLDSPATAPVQLGSAGSGRR
jgi:hypothetical protein